MDHVLVHTVDRDLRAGTPQHVRHILVPEDPIPGPK